jgi:hypothetical protein
LTMETESTPTGFQVFRLVTACLVTPVILTVWLSVSLDAMVAYFGGHPDGPAAVMLGAFVIVLGLLAPFTCLILVGLPYALIMLMKGRLNLLAVALPTLFLAVVYALVLYRSLLYYRHPAFALSVALLSVPGVMLSGLCFYVVGAWGIAQETLESPADSAAAGGDTDSCDVQQSPAG